MGSIPEISLGSTDPGIPSLGMGTAEYPFNASETMKSAILKAIKLGYRRFDSAAPYKSEQPLGETINEAQSLGFIKSRDELFITSKPWCSNTHHEKLREGYICIVCFYKVAMNQVWQQKKLREFCKEKGMHITAYFGALTELWVCEVLKEIADQEENCCSGDILLSFTDFSI
ncbi:D-galacturonate reductase-like [Macadamia integrifolia]|uniref:D-galacturonate reductase-like n=1 Tax=Macadamia integrifolia TaxID=60698 RepID=UPI001C4E684B|nr:D-galacturonate reductase-like [Macadamia integrifolia]